MAGMEGLGIAGPEALRHALTNGHDPLISITQFQDENGVLLRTLQPALSFFDLHGVRRVEFHKSMCEDLRARLLAKIEEIASGNQRGKTKLLEGMLEKAFNTIKVVELRPVVHCIMKHLPNVKEKYLKAITEDPQLYKESSVEVKRQIWTEKTNLFGDEVSPLLNDYIREKERLLFNHDSTSSFFSLAPKQRRQGKVVQELANMVGKNVLLYDTVLTFLRTLFVRTKNVHYCTLRAELLMALHDQDVQQVCGLDSCYKFVWCVDACVREKVVDEKRSRELQQFLDGVHQESADEHQLLGDVSMILCDPYAVNFLALSAIKCLQSCISSEMNPRDSKVLALLVRMLALGLGAWEMLDRQVFREPHFDRNVMMKFFPTLTMMMVEDQERTIAARICAESGAAGGDAAGVTQVTPIATVPGTYLKFVMDNHIASLFGLYYTLHVVRHKDKPAILRILPTLMSCDHDRALDDTFLHAFITLLRPLVDEFSGEEFCKAVFDDFLSMSVARENVLWHILRLLWFVHRKLPRQRLDSLMDTIGKIKHSDTIGVLHRQLQEKITQEQPPPSVTSAKPSAEAIKSPSPPPFIIPATPMHNF